MPKEISIRLAPAIAFNDKAIRKELVKRSGLTDFKYQITRRSLDARHKPVYLLKLNLFESGEPIPSLIPNFEFNDVTDKDPVAIIGSGPAGLFAALQLIQLGIKPLIFERGKDVRSRRRDLAKINKEHIVDPNSNYCFGEGGAGTYSDGKLYTRSKKKGDVLGVLQLLVKFGAKEDILIDAHPHIGTNKLPGIITNIREFIIDCGGEVHFEKKLTDIQLESNIIKSIEFNSSEKLQIDRIILATGHSARDIFELLFKKSLEINFKPFALGVRVEHPQELIDSIQYKSKTRGSNLPPASYSLVEQVKEKGVYSFCMCPGGIIAPCATKPGEVVTNGWSPSKRNNPFANSGMVVTVEQNDIKYENALSGMQFQSKIEQLACEYAGKSQTAPALRITDFVNGKISDTLPNCSYQPGINPVDLSKVLPQFIHSRLKEAFKAFDKKMKGFITEEAVVVGVESRSSSPIRIPRDQMTLEHTQIKGLYPCGEGAGYAGGIVSAAIDGQRCANAIAHKLGDKRKKSRTA